MKRHVWFCMLLHIPLLLSLPLPYHFLPFPVFLSPFNFHTLLFIPPSLLPSPFPSLSVFFHFFCPSSFSFTLIPFLLPPFFIYAVLTPFCFYFPFCLFSLPHSSSLPSLTPLSLSLLYFHFSPLLLSFFRNLSPAFYFPFPFPHLYPSFIYSVSCTSRLFPIFFPKE